MAGKPGQFPQGNRGNGNVPPEAGKPCGWPGWLVWTILRVPSKAKLIHEYDEQNHRFVTSHSTGIGDSISPTILTLPAMNPKMSLFYLLRPGQP